MLRYFLDNQPVQGPLYADGLTLKKERNRRYWGFLYRKLGFVEGSSNLRFEEPDAVAVLTNTLDRDGVQGQTPFRLERSGQVLYDGFVDYATLRADSNGIDVGLRDEVAVLDLSAQAATVFGLESSGVLSLHPRRLGGLPGLIADPNSLTVQRSESSAVPITHSVPLTRRAEKDETVAGTLEPVITPLASDRMYYNSTGKDQLVTLNGLVSVTATAGSNRTATLRAVSIGTPGFADIGQWDIGPVAVSIRAAVSVSIWIKAGDSLKLEWTGSGSVNSFNFTYGVDTAIRIGDEPDVAGSMAYGLRVNSVVRQLIEKATSGKLAFRSDFLSIDPDGALFLCNGAGVRGIRKNLAVSLQSVFDNLNALFCLAMWVEDGVLRLEKRTNRPTGTTRIDAVLSRTEGVATEMLYNSVKAGYTNWQAENSALSADEPNGLRTYSTGITALRSELNLVSEWVTASGVIETQRRKQFDTKTAGSAKADSLDDALFLVANFGGRAERLELSGQVSGVYDPETLYNLRVTPGRCVSRWADWLSSSLPLNAESVQGSDSLRSSYNGDVVNEHQPIVGNRGAVPKLVTLTTPMSMDEYADCGDWIEYDYAGQTRRGEVLNISWQLSQTGETANITLLER